MYKIGVIGDRESVLGFKAVGLDVFPTDDPSEARKILKRIAKEDFAIIYVTEQIYQYMLDEVEEYNDQRLPAIIPIPGKEGTLGIGMTSVKKSVERAVGADILFGGDN
ncbi:MAG: V-type ATP synthase subunit F [Firmicutes bacterium]|jgi:V/A-type H+-transporting ATPase subunit F|nr:V-type ATP synthase subunit F [Bacillota bacterium]MBQ1430032.1 V-type ATP synthase subunit F [Bacillota bacterium]MBQ1630528.1 V-type ATP synthase subunit F [Bacillota bacterium]MBQ1690524.1 V-type ATP synthase subunit F [Bacillota bacterium]MBQ1715285.1 V-type ATP synthase subunit F [Bacillota bacterium]